MLYLILIISVKTNIISFIDIEIGTIALLFLLILDVLTSILLEEPVAIDVTKNEVIIRVRKNSVQK